MPSPTPRHGLDRPIGNETHTRASFNALIDELDAAIPLGNEKVTILASAAFSGSTAATDAAIPDGVSVKRIVAAEAGWPVSADGSVVTFKHPGEITHVWQEFQTRPTDGTAPRKWLRRWNSGSSAWSSWGELLQSGASGDPFPQYLLESLADAKGDLAVATAADVWGRLPVGTDRQFAVADAAQTTNLRYVSFPLVLIQAFWIEGNISVRTGTHRLYIEGAWRDVIVRASLGTPPAGASAIFDLNKNGTTMFTTQANRPTIAAGTNAQRAVPDVTTIADGDYLTVDVDQVGSTTAGANLVLGVWGRPSLY